MKMTLRLIEGTDGRRYFQATDDDNLTIMAADGDTIDPVQIGEWSVVPNMPAVEFECGDGESFYLAVEAIHDAAICWP